jgi:DNA-binding SARP family transcriptional activator
MIRLQVFGDPALYQGEGAEPLRLVRQTKRFALLLYLACSEERAPRTRDDLVALFWPEADSHRAFNALRQGLFVIRRELGPEILNGVGSAHVSVNRSLLVSELDLFMRSLQAGAPAAALKLYRDDFLAGFHVSEAPEFCFWVEEERARIRNLAARAAEELARVAEAHHDAAGALYWWRRALELDPFDEPTLRRIISLLVRSGNRSAAFTEFVRFQQRAEKELGIELSPMTVQLAARAARGDAGGDYPWAGDRRESSGPATHRSRFRRASDRYPL